MNLIIDISKISSHNMTTYRLYYRVNGNSPYEVHSHIIQYKTILYFFAFQYSCKSNKSTLYWPGLLVNHTANKIPYLVILPNSDWTINPCKTIPTITNQPQFCERLFRRSSHISVTEKPIDLILESKWMCDYHNIIKGPKSECFSMQPPGPQPLAFRPPVHRRQDRSHHGKK